MKIKTHSLLNRIIVMLHDICVIPLAWMIAYGLRFDSIPPVFWNIALKALPFVIFIQICTYPIFGLYRGIWRFASMPDLMRILKAVCLGTCVIGVMMWVWTHGEHFPRSILAIYALLLMVFLGGSRLAVRSLKDMKTLSQTQKRVLIVGADMAADNLLRTLRHEQRYIPIVLVDDDIKRQGHELQGVPVKGFCKDIPHLVKKYAIDFIIIALPSASSQILRDIVKHCENTYVPFQILPKLLDIQTLRPVDIEDLLGRAPVNLNDEALFQHLTGKKILVTGGGGSIGAEICRQIAALNPAELIIVENNEFNLYALQMHLSMPISAELADITDIIAMENIMQRYTPDIIFHAAAYKHVPLLEQHVRSAVKNNVLGTRILARLANHYQVKTFVLISTDKAVNPKNILGYTKRAAEMICQHYALTSATKFVTVRFGNVLGSAGSVIPLFKKQLESGGPLTVTHPEMTRFFMTIPEATQLILHATVMSKGGEIFVLDMGDPIKIQYLAEQLIRLSGRTPEKDIEIVHIGLRLGEKMHEELFYAHEALQPTAHEKILLARSQRRKNCMDKIYDLEKCCKEGESEVELRDKLEELVKM